MTRVLSIAKVRVRSDLERDYLEVMARLAACAAEREQGLWVFRHGGDPHTFVEFSESRGAADHRSVRHHTDEEAALDAMEVEVRDAVVGEAVGPLAAGGEDGEVLPLGEHRQRAGRVARGHHALVRVEGQLTRHRLVDLGVEREDRTEGADEVALERMGVRLDEVVR